MKFLSFECRKELTPKMTSTLHDTENMDLQQLIQMLEQITAIISTLQNKQNEWLFCGVFVNCFKN